MRRELTAAFMSVALLAAAVPARAQVPDSARTPSAADTARVHRADRRAREHLIANAAPIRWYHVVALVAGAAAVSAIDEPLDRYTTRHHSQGLADVAKAFRHEGEPVFYAGVSLGVLAAGVVSGNANLQRAGARLVASVGAAAVIMETVKLSLGRSRPNEGVGAFSFHPFSTLNDSAGVEARSSMPSGHTMAAFAIATSLADDIHNNLVHVGLFTFAAGAGFSRLYEHRHWASDVAVGAALGITTAKLVSGRWRIFHLRPPAFLITPTGAPALAWHGTF